ncbi:TlpA family protein disulfide reductase [Luteimonas aestuarii]|nr:TlpA disulfide reductase family protein [Luteimonas aestuarii]
MRWIVGAMAVALGMAALHAMPALASPDVGEVPPDYLGKTPKGEEIRISEHRGKVLVVTFWASWCPHCRRQFPVLDALQQHIDPSQLRVVVVNFKEDTPTYRAILRQARDSAVTWTHDRSGAVSDAYGVNSVPHTFVIDKAGLVANVSRGYSADSIQAFGAVIDELLAEPPPNEDPPAAEPVASFAPGA